MDLKAESRIPFPAPAVFTAYRDHMLELVPYLPNVQRVEPLSRKENGSSLDVVNEWIGGGDIPAAVRTVLGESLLSWTDYATWKADTLECEWRIETRALGGAVSAAGTNSFLQGGPSETILSVRGKLQIDPKKLRGVPGFLAGTIARTAESFFADKVQANLAETAAGLTKFMSAQR